MLSIVKEVILEAVSLSVPLVIDADALYLVSQDLGLVRGSRRCVLTPNKAEFEALVRAAILLLELEGGSGCNGGNGGNGSDSSQQQHEAALLLTGLRGGDEMGRLHCLCLVLGGGVTVIKKVLLLCISSQHQKLIILILLKRGTLT